MYNFYEEIWFCIGYIFTIWESWVDASLIKCVLSRQETLGHPLAGRKSFFRDCQIIFQGD